MKTVVNTQQVAHLWANQSQSNARNGRGNFYFSGRAIYSYRMSWLLAVMTDKRDAAGERIVITNSLRASNTTARHMRHVEGALRGLPFRIIEVETKLQSDDARDILAGDNRTLSRLALACGNESRDAFGKALRKRCEYRAAKGKRNI